MSKRQNKKETQAYWVGALILVMVITACSYFVYLMVTDKSVEVDKNTGCPVNPDEIAGHTIFLIDTTDKLSKQEQSAVEVDIKNRILELPEYHRVSLFVLSENINKSIESLINICSPRKFDAKRDDEFSTGKQYLDKQFEQKFKAPILEVTKKLTDGTPGNASPIFEVIKMVKTNGFDRFSNGKQKVLNLVIYSDLLHHTNEFTLYQSNPSYANLINSNYGMKALPKLQGIEVSINYFIHEPAFQKGPFVDFWRELIKDRGGKIVELKSV
jgi:hypothetical protein